MKQDRMTKLKTGKSYYQLIDVTGEYPMDHLFDDYNEAVKLASDLSKVDKAIVVIQIQPLCMFAWETHPTKVETNFWKNT